MAKHYAAVFARVVIAQIIAIILGLLGVIPVHYFVSRDRNGKFN